MIQLFSNMVRFSIVAMIVHFILGSQAIAGIIAVDSSDGGYSQGDVVLLITYILMALVFSFLCSVAEAVLLSITSLPGKLNLRTVLAFDILMNKYFQDLRGHLHVFPAPI